MAPNTNIAATYEEFSKLTERPKLLSTGQRAMFQLAVAGGAAAEAALAPIGGAPGQKGTAAARDLAWLHHFNEGVSKIAGREGMSVSAMQAAGSFAGLGADFALLEESLTPMMAGIAKEITTNAKAVDVLSKTLRGGMAFGTYDAMSEKSPNRLQAGLKGFAIGGAWDLALSVPGFMKSKGVAGSKAAADDIIAKANAGAPPSPAADIAASVKAQHDAEIGRMELRPEHGLWTYALGQRGMSVIVRDIAGQSQVIEVRPGKVYDAYREVRSLVAQGGSVENYRVHPEDSHMVNEFVRIQTLAEESKYRGTVVRTPEGKAEAVAQVSKSEGVPAEAVSKNTVEIANVPVQHPIMKKAEPVAKAVAETPMTPAQIDTALKAKAGINETERKFLNYHVNKIWDPAVPFEDKRSSVVIVAKNAPELLPQQFKSQLVKGAKAVRAERKTIARVKGRTVEGKPLEVEITMSPIEEARQETISQTEKFGKKKVTQETEAGAKAKETKARGRGKRGGARALLEGPEDPSTFKARRPHDIEVRKSPYDATWEVLERRSSSDEAASVSVKHPYNFNSEAEATKFAEDLRSKIEKPTESDFDIRSMIPRSEERVYETSGDEGAVTAEGETFGSLNEAMDASGDHKYAVSPAGRKDVATQLAEISLKDRVMGSIEDVAKGDLPQIGKALAQRGWQAILLKGYEPDKVEIVYFRPEDRAGVIPLVNSYDQYISQQAGRFFDSNGHPTRTLGAVEHGRLGAAFGIPAEDIAKFDPKTHGRGVKPASEIRVRPKGQRLVMGQQDMNELYQNAKGLAVPSMNELAQSLGIDLPLSLQNGDPLIILTPDVGKETLFHERLHVNGMHAGTYDNFPEHIEEGDRKTALELGEGLSKDFAGYKFLGHRILVEEAFTHAATALRYGNADYLDRLAQYDTSVAHVVNFVFNTANNLLERTFGASDTVPVRIFQRTLWDLMRRGSDEVAEAVEQGSRAGDSGIASWWDPKTNSWVLKAGPGRELVFEDINSLWDHLLDDDKNFMAPSASLRAEMGGVRGNMAPIGHEPANRPLPVPDAPPDKYKVGLSAMSALWRPTMPWVATVHEQLNTFFRKTGNYLPLYERVKGVDEQYRQGERWLQQTLEEAGDLVRPFGGRKMRSTFDYLTLSEAERTPAAQAKYGLTPADALQANKVWQWMLQFRQDTGIDIPRYMNEYHPKLRSFGWAPERAFGPITAPQSASYWDRLIRHDGKWEPQDAHLGRFMNLVVREGMEKKFTGKALDELEKITEKKTPDGQYIIPNTVRWPLTNYSRYMRGIPDTSQQVINKVMSDVFDTINEKAKALNQKLPANAQIPMITTPPKTVMNRFMLASYVMGLGLRPAIAVRDSMWSFVSALTVLGPVRFGRAFSSFMMSPSASLDFADQMGAMLRKNNVGEFYGDLTAETPPTGPGWMDRVTKWSNALLAPSRWGHNFGRALMFHGEFHDAVESIAAYRAGRISVDDLLENSTMWFMDRPAQSNLLRLVSDAHIPVEDVATKIGLEAVDLTQWPYRRGTQPALLRYGAGRIFGQYGVWPANYADFLYRIGRKWTEKPALAARTSAMWVAVNYAASHLMEQGLGADTSRWFWTSPAGFAGSPHADFVHAVMVAPEDTDEGHQARKTILEYPLNFIPALGEMRSVMKGIEEGGGELNWNSTLRAMGFKPMADVNQDQDWQDWVKTQMGFENMRRKP
jgi:hypothetical protein